MRTSRFPFLAPGLCLAVSGMAAAQTSRRDGMQDAYRKQLSNNAIFFRGAPLYHVIPVKDTVTYSLAYDSVDVTVGPDKGHDPNATAANNALSFTGYSAAPLVSFSAKNFGMGFLAEKGFRHAHYREDVPTTGGGPGAFAETESRMDYSGIGLYVYTTPTVSFLPKFISPTLILGGKAMNAEHRVEKAAFGRGAGESEVTKYRYPIQRTTAGGNVSIRLAKRVNVMPWLDGTWTRLGDAKDGNGDPIDAEGQGRTPAEAALNEDQYLYWMLEPKVRFGLDVAAVLGNFEVNFGGVLGMIGGMNLGSDRIVSRSVTINLSYTAKAK